MKQIMILSLFLLLMTPIYSQDSCDPSLTPVENKIMKYKKRGQLLERCEGFYRSEITQHEGILSVVGILQGKLNYDLDDSEIVEIISLHVDDQDTFIRAQGIPLKLYYRMDAIIPPGEKLSWPIKDVIRPSETPSSEISILGWVEEENQTIYVPLRAKPRISKVLNDNTIRIYFRPSMDVENIKYAFESHKDNTSSGWKKNSQTMYDAGQPILIQLPDQQPGTITVTIHGNLQIDEDSEVEEKIMIRVKEQ